MRNKENIAFNPRLTSRPIIPWIILTFNKLLKILTGSMPWILLIVAASLFTAYIIIRYTKDLYQSSSVLQLDIKK